MTAKIFYLPVFDRERSPVESARLDAATEWLLSEIDDPASVENLRALAQKELEDPRDAIHRIWAETFLEEVLQMRQQPRLNTSPRIPTVSKKTELAAVIRQRDALLVLLNEIDALGDDFEVQARACLKRRFGILDPSSGG